MAGKTPQAFSAARSLTGFWTGAKTGLPSFSFLAMAPMQQSAAIATTAAAMRPPMSPASSLLDFFLRRFLEDFFWVFSDYSSFKLI